MTQQALDDDERAELDRLRSERAGRAGSAVAPPAGNSGIREARSERLTEVVDERLADRVEATVRFAQSWAAVAKVEDRLVARGLTAAQRLPEVSVTYPLMDLGGRVELRGPASPLGTLAWVPPLVVSVVEVLARVAREPEPKPRS